MPLALSRSPSVTDWNVEFPKSRFSMVVNVCANTMKVPKQVRRERETGEREWRERREREKGRETATSSPTLSAASILYAIATPYTHTCRDELLYTCYTRRPSLQCAKLANSNPSVAYQTATDRNDCYRLGDVTDPSWEVMDPAKPRKGIVLKYVHSYSYSHTSSYSYSYSYSHSYSSLFLSLFEPS